MNTGNRITEEKIKRRIVEKLYDYESESNKADQKADGAIVKTTEEGAPAASAQQARASETKTVVKDFIKRIPVISNIIIWLSRLKKMPWRVLHIDEELQLLKSDVSMLTRKIDTLSLSVEAMHLKFQEVLTERIGAVHSRIGAVDGRVSSLNDRLETVGSHVVSLHEKTDSIHSKLDHIKPIITAGDNIVITTVDDFIMGFPGEEWRLPAFQIIRGHLEPGLVKVFKKHLQAGQVVVDVGANVGLYTLIAAQYIGVQGRVYSYEPTPRTFDILKNNIQINGYLETNIIRLNRCAVSDRSNAKINFFVYKNSLTHNTLFPEADVDHEVTEIATVALDDVLSNEAHIDVVKIDAEGAEPLVLKGMKKIITNNPRIAIFMEFAPSHLQRAGIDVAAFIREIKDNGFMIEQVVEPLGEIAPISDTELMNIYSVNLKLTLRKNSEERMRSN